MSLDEECAAHSGGSQAASGRRWSRRPCASDWGLWRTFTANLEALDSYLGRIEEPKSLGWKMRAKIGERKRWYDLPEEVEGGP